MFTIVPFRLFVYNSWRCYSLRLSSKKLGDEVSSAVTSWISWRFVIFRIHRWDFRFADSCRFWDSESNVLDGCRWSFSGKPFV